MNKQTILITGATRGIGWALAQQAAKQNYKLILAGRDSTKLQTRRSELLNYFPTATVQIAVFDVCNRLAVRQAALTSGKIDFLINNAGNIADNWWIKLSTQNWDQVITTNLTGTFNVTHYFTNQINPGGQIVMLTSKSALFGNPGQANYSAAKAGIIGLTKTLALELKRFDLRVNCVAPAAKTDMTLPAIEKIKQHFAGKLPAEWELGSSKQVAEFIINRLLKTKQTGMIYSVNGDKLGYWEEPIFHELI